MDTVASALLQEVDPRVLGSRLRAARLARGWTQTDLAGELCSVGYVSRLESGQRRPVASVLDALAAKLEIAVDELLRGPTARQQDEIKLQLDYAELELESGDVIEGESLARQARDRAALTTSQELADRATFLIAWALEAQGGVDDAILELEDLLARPVATLLGVRAAIALSRCYRESGDLQQAIDAGERVVRELQGTPLDSTDEAVQLTVTIAASYYERGDTGQAVRICRRAIDKADRLDSPKARAAAYWNASMMESDRGAIRDALPLAERALSLMTEGQDGRNLARLRGVVADIQLSLDPPQVDSAKMQLDRAEEELKLSGGSALDLVRNHITRARALLLGGEHSAARSLCVEVLADVIDTAPDLAADARSLEGQAAAAMGDLATAQTAYRHAVMLLTGIGSDRTAGQLWFELAGLLEGIGDFETARTAYRSAAASAGLRSRPSVAAASESGIDKLAIDRVAID